MYVCVCKYSSTIEIPSVHNISTHRCMTSMKNCLTDIYQAWLALLVCADQHGQHLHDG